MYSLAHVIYININTSIVAMCIFVNLHIHAIDIQGGEDS